MPKRDICPGISYKIVSDGIAAAWLKSSFCEWAIFIFFLTRNHWCKHTQFHTEGGWGETPKICLRAWTWAISAVMSLVPLECDLWPLCCHIRPRTPTPSTVLPAFHWVSAGCEMKEAVEDEDRHLFPFAGLNQQDLRSLLQQWNKAVSSLRSSC